MNLWFVRPNFIFFIRHFFNVYFKTELIYCLYIYFFNIMLCKGSRQCGRKILSLGGRSETQWFIYRNEE